MYYLPHPPEGEKRQEEEEEGTLWEIKNDGETNARYISVGKFQIIAVGYYYT